MATPKKLPSGQWRTLVFSHLQYLTDDKGKPLIDSKTQKQKTKRVYESFTADTKKESAFQAAEYQKNKKRIENGDLTVKEALEEYVKSKENVLSPSTIRGYKSCIQNYYSGIQDTKIRRLDVNDVQTWINSLSAIKSPKTVRNVNALFTAALDMFAPEMHLKVQLPSKKRPNLYCPGDSDIQRLLTHVAGRELELAILLAAFGPMRRSEICALTSDDIHGNIISINKAMVFTADKHWIIKTPKTYDSNRDIEFPDFVIEKLKNIDGRIIKANPDQISNRFRRAIKFSGCPNFRFHDLRHYGASIMHAIGIPDQYIMARGGWRTDGVMKSIYRNTIDEQTKKVNTRINNYFTNIMMARDIIYPNEKFALPLPAEFNLDVYLDILWDACALIYARKLTHPEKTIDNYNTILFGLLDHYNLEHEDDVIADIEKEMFHTFEIGKKNLFKNLIPKYLEEISF